MRGKRTVGSIDKKHDSTSKYQIGLGYSIVDMPFAYDFYALIRFAAMIRVVVIFKRIDYN